MHFIDKQDGAQAMALEPLPGVIHFAAEIFDSCQNSIEAAEVSARVVGDDSRQGGFANPRGAMQQQIADAIGGNGTAKETSLRQDRALSDEFIQGAWSHPIGQRSLALAQLIAVMGEQICCHAGISIRQF